jgi:hypothetical protein
LPFIFVIHHFRNSLYRFFAFVVALQILNMSIDSPSAQMPKYVPNAENFNYIDTYVEFIVEVVLKYENAIPETKNRPQKEWQMQKYELVFQKIVPITVPSVFQESGNRFFNYTNGYAYQFIKEINPPPPKAC